jgi:hypothetical protein
MTIEREQMKEGHVQQSIREQPTGEQVEWLKQTYPLIGVLLDDTRYWEEGMIRRVLVESVIEDTRKKTPEAGRLSVQHFFAQLIPKWTERTGHTQGHQREGNGNAFYFTPQEAESMLWNIYTVMAAPSYALPYGLRDLSEDSVNWLRTIYAKAPGKRGIRTGQRAFGDSEIEQVFVWEPLDQRRQAAAEKRIRDIEQRIVIELKTMDEGTEIIVDPGYAIDEEEEQAEDLEREDDDYPDVSEEEQWQQEAVAEDDLVKLYRHQALRVPLLHADDEEERRVNRRRFRTTIARDHSVKRTVRGTEARPVFCG